MTLIEVVVAVGIFAFVFIPLMSLFSSNVDTFRAVREYVTVIHIAEGQMHKFTNIINNLAPSDTISYINEDLTPEVIRDYPDNLSWLANLKITGTVCLAAATDGVGSYQIIINAAWGNDRNYSISSVVPFRAFVTTAETIARPPVQAP